MTNKIGPMDQGALGKLGNKVEDTGNARSPLAPASGPGKPGSGDAPAGGETVRLTAGGQLLSRLEASLNSAPSVDAAKVAEVKAAITSGNYEIDSVAIADAMIRLERSLGE